MIKKTFLTTSLFFIHKKRFYFSNACDSRVCTQFVSNVLSLSFFLPSDYHHYYQSCFYNWIAVSDVIFESVSKIACSVLDRVDLLFNHHPDNGDINAPVSYGSVILCVSLIGLIATMADDSALAISKGNGNFANGLYQILSKTPGNIFFSPISAHAVLSLAYQGAAGETAESFKSALSIPLAKTVAEGYKNVMAALNSVENVTLHIANKIFLQENYKLKDSFKTIATDYFLSEAENVNFADGNVAAGVINYWVEEKTNSKIKDLIQPQDLNDLTRLVLVNAIYFKGAWANKFDPDVTQTEPFWISAEESVDCQMMHASKNYFYAENAELDAKILEIPYTNRDLSLVIVLPNARDGIENLETKLTNVEFASLLKQTRNLKVDLSLPKFKIETTIGLNEPLKKLGLGRIFTEEAEFPDMIESDEPLLVSKVIQKAFIEVNEEGAEAAAATGMVMMTFAMPIMTPNMSFVADHPFVFALTHRRGFEDLSILFLGKLQQPKT